MPTISIPYSFTPNTSAASAQVNANFNAVATFFNSTKLDSTNLQAGAVINATLAAGAVTGDKLNSAIVDNSTIQLSSNTLSVVSGGITLTQLASAVQNALTPTGTILPYGGTSAPPGFLICAGASVSTTTYAALYAVIGTAFGTSGAGYFNVPNLQGMFLRGISNSSGVDPDATTRGQLLPGGASGNAVGSYQADEFASHTHVLIATGSGGSSYNNAVLDAVSGGPYNDRPPIASTGGYETRPKNVYVSYIIKT